jgi:thiol-disulfide isomerase/thioredoxin
VDTARSRFADLAGLMLLVAVVGLVFWKITTPPAVEPPVPAGTAMPRLDVAGWVNVPEGEAFEPTGKVLVVDLWATYCGPCRNEIPRLAKVVQEYRPLGVEFIGLTDEPEGDLERIRKFIAAVPGFDWPVGYGARKFMMELQIQAIPTVIVFGADGRARWSWVGEGAEGLRAALDEALLAANKAERRAAKEPKDG